MSMDEETLKRIAQETFDPTWPKAGEVWQHYKGGLYSIVAVAVHESELVPLVVYRSQEKGFVWARPVSVFMDTFFDADGVKKPRFERVR